MSPATPLQTNAASVAPNDSADTKERLLDAAEQLFAERGFEGTSVRAVTQLAGSSVSAANYHFGSKEALMAAVIRRRMEPLNENRIAALAALEAGGPFEIEQVFDAFFRASFERLAKARSEGGNVTFPRQVAARLYSDPPELVQSLKHEIFGEVNARFAAAITQALSGAPPHVLRLIQEFAIASLVHLISGQVDEELAANWARSAGQGDAAYEPLLQALILQNAAGARALAGKAS